MRTIGSGSLDLTGGERFDAIAAAALAGSAASVVAGCTRQSPVASLLAGLGCLSLAALSYLVRFARASWRPRRTTVVSRHLAFVALIVVPSCLTSVTPLRSLVLAALAVGIFLGFTAFREAFTANTRGVFSPRAFAAVVAATGILVLAVRLATRILEARRDVLPWFCLAPSVGEPEWGFNHIIDFLLIVMFPIVAAMGGAPARRREAWLWRAAAWILGLGIVLSFCRAAWLALLLEILLLAVCDRALRRPLAVGAAALATVALLVPGAAQRAASALTVAYQTNVQRLDQWAAALGLIRKSPFLGYGLGSFAALYREWTPAGTWRTHFCPHNLFLHVTVECGAPALFCFVAWVAPLFLLLRGRAGAAAADMDPARAAVLLGGIVAVAGLLCFGLFDL